jgi:ketopantoate hydroxymethyltransferase
LYDDITGAIGEYVNDVKRVDFPNKDESYTS